MLRLRKRKERWEHSLGLGLERDEKEWEGLCLGLERGKRGEEGDHCLLLGRGW